jgi:hypothetical protein
MAAKEPTVSDYMELHDLAKSLIDKLEDARLDWKEGTSDEPAIRNEMKGYRGRLTRLRRKAGL